MEFITLCEHYHNEKVEVNPKYIGMMAQRRDGNGDRYTTIWIAGVYSLNVIESIDDIKNKINNLED